MLSLANRECGDVLSKFAGYAMRSWYLCMSLYRDCLLAVSLEMRGLFLFWPLHGYVCMVSGLYLPSLKFVLCMAMFA